MTERDDYTTLAREIETRDPTAALVIHISGEVKVVPLFRDVPVVVGRTHPADVVISDPSLSRRHARLVWTTDGVEVSDLGSTNGTHVRGNPIQTARVGAGETILFGEVSANVNISAAETALKGLDSLELFLIRVEEEIVRARSFGRPIALVFVRAAARDPSDSWVARIRQDTRPVDAVARYGSRALMIILPEAGREDAVRMIHGLVQPRIGEPTLLAGVAMFPEAATSDALVDDARHAARSASPDQPVCVFGLGAKRDHSPLVVSPAMTDVLELVDRVARSTIPVLIHGETGSGKEVVAQEIHRRSPRQGKPMKSINCGAIPATLMEGTLFGHERGAYTGADTAAPGIFEQAHGGTVFLDEVGELSAGAQAALLRVLETKQVTRIGGTAVVEVDVRVIAATHRKLDSMVESGAFRQDLLYRLNAMTLTVPPLRDRPEDIDPLTDHFLREAATASGFPSLAFSDESRELLRAYRWPGNVRELRNVIERAVVISGGEPLTPDLLPEELSRAADPPEMFESGSGLDFKERVRRYETELIVDALRRANGNQTQAAKLLRMPLRTLVHKIKAYELKKGY
ncbi:MAG: sigma 54-interacting transcriptional regulator [Myxococcota bacterium]